MRDAPSSRPSASSAPLRPSAFVVGIDFGPAGDEALRQAAGLAASSGAMLHVVHCLDGDARAHADRVELELGRTRDRLAAHLARHLPPMEEDLRIGMHVRIGRVAPALLQIAADVEADLIVIGGRPRGLARFLATSTEQRLLRAARCPVLVARRKDYRASERSPVIEPPCDACVATRRASEGRQWWCERHAAHHVHGHTYSYSRRFALGEHDSEVVPTGISMSR